jgi:hypothetical protein
MVSIPLPLLGLKETTVHQSRVITWASPGRSRATEQPVGLIANGLPVQVLSKAFTGFACRTKLGPHMTSVINIDGNHSMSIMDNIGLIANGSPMQIPSKAFTGFPAGPIPVLR